MNTLKFRKMKMANSVFEIVNEEESNMDKNPFSIK